MRNKYNEITHPLYGGLIYPEFDNSTLKGAPSGLQQSFVDIMGCKGGLEAGRRAIVNPL